MPERESEAEESAQTLSLQSDNFEYIKGSEAEERRLYQKVFQPKIKRKPYKKRSVRKTCEELVNSFYPLTEVTYDAMRNRLISQFDRCSRQTILSYLGRPETRQIETIRHNIKTQNTERSKDHTFTHILPAKRGYVEVFGFAFLQQRGVQTFFKLYHTRQTEINEPFSPPQTPPHESYALKESSCEVSAEFKEALAYAKRQVSENSSKKNFLSFNIGCKDVKEKPVLQANPKGETDGDRERVFKREKKIEVSKSNLSVEERRLFGVYDTSVMGAS